MSAEVKTLFVGLLVGIAHVASGLAVMVEPLALTVTPLAALHTGVTWLGWSPRVAGVALIFAGLMAVLGSRTVFMIPHRVRVALFVPQQILLVLMMWTILWSVITGTYPDGYSPAGRGWFIEGDQIWAFILAMSHSAWLAAFLYGGRGEGAT